MLPDGVGEAECHSPTPSDTESFAKFHNRHYAPLRARLRMLVGDAATAEDLIADTMMVMWQRWAQLGGARDEAGGFPRMRAFAYTTAHNKAREFWRRSERNLSVEQFDPDSDMFTPASSASSYVEVFDTIQAIRQLPEQQRRALVMRVLGFADAEVAADLGIEEGTVRTHLALARRKLMEYLEARMGAQV